MRRALAGVQPRPGQSGDDYRPFSLPLWPRPEVHCETYQVPRPRGMRLRPLPRLCPTLVILSLSLMKTNSLQGARHAVVETLYSRAHRIGLNGTSCFLDGFCKNLSFGFYDAAVVCVLVCPALEVIIFAEEKLQGFGDDVRRRSIEKLGIELELSLYRFFDTGLDGDGFWLFRWCFQNGQRSSLSCSYKMSDMLSDNFLGPPNATAQYALVRSASEGGSDPKKLLGGLTAKKWGRSRPICPILWGHFRRGSGCKSLTVNSAGRDPGEESGEEEAEVCNSYRLHLAHLLPSGDTHRIWRGTRARQRTKFRCGLERPQYLLATSKWPKVGSLQPNTVFCPRPN